MSNKPLVSFAALALFAFAVPANAAQRADSSGAGEATCAPPSGPAAKANVTLKSHANTKQEKPKHAPHGNTRVATTDLGAKCAPAPLTTANKAPAAALVAANANQSKVASKPTGTTARNDASPKAKVKAVEAAVCAPLSDIAKKNEQALEDIRAALSKSLSPKNLPDLPASTAVPSEETPVAAKPGPVPHANANVGTPHKAPGGTALPKPSANRAPGAASEPGQKRRRDEHTRHSHRAEGRHDAGAPSSEHNPTTAL